MIATATRLPLMMPAEPIVPPAPRPKAKAAVAADLQAQYDILAEAFAHTFEIIAAQAIRIDALERKIKLPKRLAEVEEFAFVLPATGNAPARRCFDASSFLASIAERHRR